MMQPGENSGAHITYGTASATTLINERVVNVNPPRNVTMN